MSITGERRSVPLTLAAIVAVWALLYVPAIDHGFVWDDALLIEDNPQAASDRAWATALGSHYLALFGGDTREGSYYRPLSLALLLLEVRLFGDSPTGYRAVHGAWHLLNALLIFALVRGLLRGRADGASPQWGATMSAIAFLCLPYTADAVLFLTDVGDLMVLTCALLAVSAFEALRSGGRAWLLGIAVAGCTLAGLGSKETALAIPPTLVGLLLLRPVPGSTRRAAGVVAVSFAASAIYLVLRQLALPGSADIDPLAIAGGYPAAVAVALRFALAPFPMVLEHAVDKGSVLPWSIVGGIALVAGAWAVTRFRKLHPLPTALGVAWLLAVTPSLLAPTAAQAFAPRYLYVPAAALVLLASPILADKRWPIRAAAAGLILAGALLTFVRIGTWGDELELWRNEVEHDPHRASAAIHLALALERREDLGAALALNRQAAILADAAGQQRLVAMARTNAGRLLIQRFGRPDEAILELELAVRADPGYAEAYQEVGLIHARDGHWAKAERAFARACDLAPWSAAAAIGLAGALAAQGRTGEALRRLEAARAQFAESPELVAEIDARMEIVRRRGARGEGRENEPR